MMTSSMQPSVLQVASSGPVGQPLVQAPPAEGSGMMKWWILAGVLLFMFLGIAAWYFSTR